MALFPKPSEEEKDWGKTKRILTSALVLESSIQISAKNQKPVKKGDKKQRFFTSHYKFYIFLKNTERSTILKWKVGEYYIVCHILRLQEICSKFTN